MSTILPEHFLKRMSKADRDMLGKAGLLAAECEEIAIAKSEKQLQTMIRQWLNLHDMYFDCDAMHKRRRGTLGAPDFQFPYKGKFVAWECKIQKGRLSPEQHATRDKIVKHGGEWRLIQSLQEAQLHLRQLDVDSGSQCVKKTSAATVSAVGRSNT